MSYTGYVVWFIVMAVLIAAILAFGTLTMAGVLPLHHHRDDGADGAHGNEGTDEHDHDTHHHWWHRAA
jgi:hypothetical protein